MDHGLRSVLIPVLCACCFVAGCGDDAGKARSAARDFMHGIVSRIVQAGPLTLGCGIMSKKYDGDLRLREYPWLAGKRIFIDPGHGGEDAGVTGPGGLKEKDLTMAVSAKLKAALERELNVTVTLTRRQDHNTPITVRADEEGISPREVVETLRQSFAQGKDAQRLVAQGKDPARMPHHLAPLRIRAAGDIVAAPVKRKRFGQPGDRVLGRRVWHGVGPRGVGGN